MTAAATWSGTRYGARAHAHGPSVPLQASIAVAVALHVVLLTQRDGVRWAPRLPDATEAARAAVQVRVISRATPWSGTGEVAAVVPIAKTAASETARPAPPSASIEAHTRAPEDAGRAAAALPSSPTPQPVQPEARRDGPRAAAPGVPASDDDIYLPRSALSLPPSSNAPVMLTFPPHSTLVGRFESIMAIFIDESGVVQRVRIEGPQLPQELEMAARAAFMQARFTPGLKDGVPVKSRIKVAIEFDNTPPAPPSPSPTRGL